MNDPDPPQPPTIVDVTTEPLIPPPPRQDWTTKVWAFVRRYILAPLPILIIAGGAFILAMLGFKNLQVGGLFGKLLGRKTTQKATHVANSVPPERVRADGSIIPIGEPDSKGITQARVVAIQEPGLFDDPKVVKITPPGETKPISIQVPDGVKAKDVDNVIVLRPEVTAVTVKSASKIKAQRADDLLSRYEKKKD
jgi:hypothetical protein